MQYGYWHRRSQTLDTRWRCTRYVRQSLAIIPWLLSFHAAFAQDSAVAPAIGTAALPRDLSPWGMFMNADAVVKAVVVVLAIASLLTWTIWLAKSIEIMQAKRKARAGFLRAWGGGAPPPTHSNPN